MIGSDIYRTSKHASGHPLRSRGCRCASTSAGRWPGCRTARTWTARRPASPNSADFTTRTMSPRCAAASDLQQAGADDRARFNLGVNGNPVYAEMFRRPATACGASLAGAKRLRGGGVVYNPAGGTHHGMAGARAAFAFSTTRCSPSSTCSMAVWSGCSTSTSTPISATAFRSLSPTRTGCSPFPSTKGAAGPWAATIHGRAARAASMIAPAGMSRNLPLPREVNDSESGRRSERRVLPLIDAFAPEAIVVQCGADALADDPMTKLSLSNRALWAAVAAVAPRAPRLLVLGGGGYNPWSVARCWAGVWAILSGRSVPETAARIGRTASARRALAASARPQRRPRTGLPPWPMSRTRAPCVRRSSLWSTSRRHHRHRSGARSASFAAPGSC